MFYFLHGKPFIQSPKHSLDNHGVDWRRINRRGEIEIKNQFHEIESARKREDKRFRRTF